MRNAARATVVVSSVGAALTLCAAVASAKGPNDSMVLTSPEANTAVFAITNGATKPVFCSAELHGFDRYGTQTRTIAPMSTITFTMVNIPAGNYSVRWNCNGGSDGDKRFISIGGDPHPTEHVRTTVSNG